MKTIRLFPVVILVVLALLGLKLAGHLFDGTFSLRGQAMAQEKPQEKSADGAQGGGSQGEKMASVDAKSEVDGVKKSDHNPGNVSSTKPKEFISARQKELPSKSEIEVLKSLRDRRQDLDKREQSLRLRENLLKATEKRLEKRVGELKEIEAKIEKSHQQNEEKSKKGMESLVSMYSNMKPKDAARIFNTLDMEVLVSLVDQMNARKMAPVLAKMKPVVAKALTVEIAERLNKKTTKVKDADPLPSIPER
jgi:flagellar motility protein MotE (MotC chaperone)